MNLSKQHPIHNDDRYSIQQEHTGAAKPQWVARFCGEWIGARDDADALREAARSSNDALNRANLQIWNGTEYVTSNS